jgi:hypothetical protein
MKLPPARKTAAVLSFEEVERLTGLDLDAVRREQGVQELRRIFEDGRVEEALRIPLQLLPPGAYQTPSKASRRAGGRAPSLDTDLD